MPAPGAAGPALPKARLYPPECTSHMCPLIPTASNGLAVHAPLHECSLHRVNGRNVSAPSTKYATVCLRVWGDSECLASEQRKTERCRASPEKRGRRRSPRPTWGIRTRQLIARSAHKPPGGHATALTHTLFFNTRTHPTQAVHYTTIDIQLCHSHST